MSDKKPVIGTAAIIRKGNEILIAQRQKDSKFEASKWEFPGGKVEFLENPQDTIVREIKEELDLDIISGKIFDITSTKLEKNEDVLHIVLLFFECSLISDAKDRFKLIDCQDAKWITLEDLDDYDFAKADIPVVEKLKKIN